MGTDPEGDRKLNTYHLRDVQELFHKYKSIIEFHDNSRWDKVFDEVEYFKPSTKMEPLEYLDRITGEGKLRRQESDMDLLVVEYEYKKDEEGQETNEREDIRRVQYLEVKSKPVERCLESGFKQVTTAKEVWNELGVNFIGQLIYWHTPEYIIKSDPEKDVETELFPGSFLSEDMVEEYRD
ncbi:MAG: hypothetical protein SVV03_03990 [Candidatus Nanohaloarchaea archaeon]|nr:hypothetical protein [Candidatus Nanohaloarchaea archaeon]